MFKRKSKKGALELSMNTIVIIVIGVTLLILGLAFVRNIFGKVGTLAEGAFEEAQGKVSDFSTISKSLTVSPDRITIKKGDSKIITVVMANLKDKEVTTGLTVSTIKTLATDMTCTFLDTESTASNQYTIPSGEFRTIKVRVDSLSTGVLGNKVCKFIPTNNDLGVSMLETLAVKVEA